MDDVFEGDNNTDDVLFYAEQLDLFKWANNTKHIWKYPETNPYHLIITLLINNKKIMDHISHALGKRPITPQNYIFKPETQKKWGISNEKIFQIKYILQLEEITASKFCSFKDIFLLKLFKIVLEEEDDIFLYESPHIRKILGILFGRNKPMDKAEVMKVSKVWNSYKSLISYFLFRLKDTGAIKILEEIDLISEDFNNI